MGGLKFIGGQDATEVQLHEIAKLLFETSYYEYSSIGNQLNLPALEFHKIQTLKPYAKYTHILLENDVVVGFFIAATKAQLEEVEKQTSSWYREDPELLDVLKRTLDFYIKETIDSDYIVYATAMAKKYRGGRFYKILVNYRNKLGRENNCKREVFAVWESNRAAKLFFKHEGAKMLGTIDYNDMCFKERLLKGAWDI